MNHDFAPVLPDTQLRQALEHLVDLAWEEDLCHSVDLTSAATIPAEKTGACEIRSRSTAICSGIVVIPWIISKLGFGLNFEPATQDGALLAPGQSLGKLAGKARELLAAERLILNITSRMCGVATLTHQYVQQLVGTKSRLYDTRKTTAGWRRLEKYAVRCGGGHNHRTGLFDAILIKDNHLALGGTNSCPLNPQDAILNARKWLAENHQLATKATILEIEVDSLEQLRASLESPVDIILVDNFSLDDLATAVQLRDSLNSSVELEASGGVTIDRIAKIAATGVDRISCGALTHQATWIDLGLDWIAN